MEDPGVDVMARGGCCALGRVLRPSLVGCRVSCCMVFWVPFFLLSSLLLHTMSLSIGATIMPSFSTHPIPPC
jgi:hypothetical protein